MSRIFLFTILGGLVIAVITAITIRDVNAREDTKFIPVSVLSKKQANYGTDENPVSVPAISVDILEDKIHDTEWQSSVPIIRYTSLPAANNDSTDQSSDQSELHNDPGKNGNGGNSQEGGGNSNQNMNNGNGNSHQNMNNNGTGNAGGGNNNSNNGQELEKETKPDKKDLPENKDSTSDKPEKTK